MKPLKDLARLGGALLATSVLFTAGLAVHASPAAAVERAACPAVGPVSSPWGPRFAAQRAPVPFSDVTAAEFHDGVDIAAPHGAPIYAVQAGEVIYSETADPGGYGQYIQIRHDDGSTSEYGHMSRRLVDRGESVRRGQQIAKIGSEGSSTGPHLHLRIYPGAPGGRGVNPQVWLRDRGITLPCTPADNPVEEPDALVGGSKDFTGDGVADVLGRHPNGDLYLYPASGPGLTYASKVKVHSGWNTNNWLYAASLDYTPGVDLVGRNAAGDLLLYSNTGKAGTGMFDPTPTKIGSGWNVMTWLAVADVTGDKLGDMVGRRADGRVFVYPNTGKAGTGMFGAALYAGSGWNGMNAILAADYTGDGRADLVGRDGTGKLWLYPPTPTTRPPTTGAPRSARAGTPSTACPSPTPTTTTCRTSSPATTPASCGATRTTARACSPPTRTSAPTSAAAGRRSPPSADPTQAAPPPVFPRRRRGASPHPVHANVCEVRTS